MGVFETFVRGAGALAYFIYNVIREFILIGIVFIGNMFISLTWLIQANESQSVGVLDPWLYNLGLMIVWGLWVMFLMMVDNVITRMAIGDTAEGTTSRIARVVKRYTEKPEEEKK